MKKFVCLAPVALAVMTVAIDAQAASEEEATALTQANGCVACHAQDTALVGPAFVDIAARYESTDENVAQLVAKVQNGGSGSFGDVPMPPNAHVAADDIETIVRWILLL